MWQFMRIQRAGEILVRCGKGRDAFSWRVSSGEHLKQPFVQLFWQFLIYEEAYIYMLLDSKLFQLLVPSLTLLFQTTQSS